MGRVLIAIFSVSMATLMVELVLTRVFDVILTTNIAYMVITCALFGFGMSGVFIALRPAPTDERVYGYGAKVTLLFSAFIVAILPLMNVLPFDYEQIDKEPLAQAFAFLAMYFVLIVPFFLAGVLFSTLFTAFAERIQRLYFWDLVGAALGCIVIVPLLPWIGPAGILFFGAALGLYATGLLTGGKARLAAWGIAVVLVVVPILKAPEYFTFIEHTAKRGVRAARQEGKIEFTRWDPISKIDVMDSHKVFHDLGDSVPRKHIAYDGGAQSSHIYPFDGDFAALRSDLSEHVMAHFWQRGVLASHYLLEGTQPSVLIIGCAGGQEVKAALLFGAGEVHGVEMVGTVVDIGQDRYAEYNGGIMNDPRVRVIRGEGRSFLRSTDKQYDVIQIFSNHNSSSIASGTGAMDATYLQTVEAYLEYFGHLAPGGILHINHHVYPRMLTTAARAWKEMGRSDFRNHVVVYQRDGRDTLPTVLIKMTPWTEEEMARLRGLFEMPMKFDTRTHSLVENPFAPEESFLSDDFYSGDFPDELAESLPYRAGVTTDDRPFFNFLRKSVERLEPQPDRFLNVSTAGQLNSQLKTSARIPMDVVHLVVTAAISLIYILLFVVIPLQFSRAGKQGWPGRAASLVYFSCLGAGFIIIELLLIQVLRRLIGFPLYTYSLVIFTMLLGAGLGSLCSGYLGIAPDRRRWVPFVGSIGCGILLLLTYGWIEHTFLAYPLGVRCLVAALVVFPVSFFLGMPLPIGILALRRFPTGSIAWAWGMNGLFTVVGGLASIVLSLAFGFRVTLLIGFAIYVLAYFMLVRMRGQAHEAG